MIRTYSELVTIPTFKERFEYLKLNGVVSDTTFGFNRYLNQVLYHTKEWLSVRRKAIIRDGGCDLAVPDCPIWGTILIHHLNPITVDDILQRRPIVFDLENLVCISHNTHNAVHYGDASLLPTDFVERRPNDTCPWR